MDIQPVMRARARLVTRGAALLAMAVGTSVLIGWWLGDMRLKAAFSLGVTMKANTALGLACTGLSLWLLAPGEAGAKRVLGRLFAALGLAIGALTLSEHLVGWDLGIDQLLFREPPGQLFTVSPGRMGLPASLSLALLGIALLALEKSTIGGRSPAQVLACAVMTITVLPVLGYLSGAVELYGIARLTGVALHSALTLHVLGIGILLARPTLRPAARLLTDDAGGQLVRAALPPLLLLPMLLAWAGNTGQRAGLYDAPFGEALVLLALIGMFVAIIMAVAVRLSAASAQQKYLEAQRTTLLESERAARTEAERAARLKDEFLATVSHELRTPLNAILGWATVTRDASTDPQKVQRALEVIVRNARLQAQLIDDLLDISRIVSGKLRLDPKPTNLVQVVKAALTAVAPSADAKQITLQQELDTQAAALRADPARLQQVVWNLLSNAVKFTGNGGTVTVRLRRADERVELSVTDSGVGIEPDFLPFVFERFRQGDGSTTRRHGGLGLGLSIVRHLVEMHDGTVRVESPGKGQGATFTVSLPAAAATETVSVVTESAPRGLRPHANSLRGVNVLVVDDEPDARDVLVRVLSQHGATVNAEGSVDDALRAIARAKPDLIVSDVGMPERDGYDLIRSVRQRFDGNELPAIALTAFARSEDKREALEQGFQLHVTKPVDPFEVTLAVASLVGRSSGAAP